MIPAQDLLNLLKKSQEHGYSLSPYQSGQVVELIEGLQEADKWQAEHQYNQLVDCDEQYGTKLVEEFGMWGCDIICQVLDALIFGREEKAKLQTDLRIQEAANRVLSQERDYAYQVASGWESQCEMARAEIAALTPDAQAWRERETAFQSEHKVLDERMGKSDTRTNPARISS